MNRGIQVVVKVAQVFKDGCLGIGLCKLIADIRKLNALGKPAGRQAANPVLIHGLIGNTLLGGVGLAVALYLRMTAEFLSFLRGSALPAFFPALRFFAF